jgi:hypothetical protein
VHVLDSSTGERIDGFELTASQRRGGDFEVDQVTVCGEQGRCFVAFDRAYGTARVQAWQREVGKVLNLTLHADYLADAAISSDETRIAVATDQGRFLLFKVDGIPRSVLSGLGSYPHLTTLEDGGFLVASAEGRLSRVSPEGALAFSVHLATARAPTVDETYAALRRAPLLSLRPPPSAAGDIPCDLFYWYAQRPGGGLELINWQPGKAIDFRWMHAVQAGLRFPRSRRYKVTIRAAAKYFDQEPQNQPSWDSILEMREQVVRNERPAPEFRLLIDGERVGHARPEGGKLVPFTTERITRGWATLSPAEDEFTVFSGTIDAPGGIHRLGLEARNMVDCYATRITIE